MPSDPSIAWSSERLEWLGDHVLKTLTADLLNDLFPSAGEGELTVRYFFSLVPPVHVRTTEFVTHTLVLP